MRRYFGSLLPLYGADDTLLDSPGSFFEVMALSPQSAGSPGTSPGESSPFSDLLSNIRDVVLRCALSERGLGGFERCHPRTNIYIVRHEAIESRRNTKGADPDLADSVYIKGKIIIALK